MSNLKTAFEQLRDKLNTDLFPSVFPNKLSLTPKHPDFVEQDAEFPYFGLLFMGENPEYQGSDFWWIQPSKEMASFELWVTIGQSATDSLSADLMDVVALVRQSVVALTSDRENVDFRVQVSGVQCQYEPSGRWAWARVQIVIGAYG